MKINELSKFLCEFSNTRSTSNCPFKFKYILKKRMGLSFAILAMVKDSLFAGYLGLVSIIIFISLISLIPKQSLWFTVTSSVMLEYNFV